MSPCCEPEKWVFIVWAMLVFAHAVWFCAWLDLRATMHTMWPMENKKQEGVNAKTMKKIYGWLAFDVSNDADDLIAKQAFREGWGAIRPTIPATLIWAAVTAAAMIAGGLSPFYVVLINLLVFAASAQLTVLGMLTIHAPMPIIWLAASVVNLRFVIFSAGIRPYFRHLGLKQRLFYGFLNGDINSMLFGHRYRDAEPAPATLSQSGFFMGMAIPNYIAWQVGIAMGVFFASFIPNEWGLKLAGTITLLVLILKTVNHWATVCACLAAALVAVQLQHLPYKLWVIVAIVVGVLVGMVIEFVWKNAFLSASDRRVRGGK